MTNKALRKTFFEELKKAAGICGHCNRNRFLCSATAAGNVQLPPTLPTLLVIRVLEKVFQDRGATKAASEKAAWVADGAVRALLEEAGEAIGNLSSLLELDWESLEEQTAVIVLQQIALGAKIRHYVATGELE